MNICKAILNVFVRHFMNLKSLSVDNCSFAASILKPETESGQFCLKSSF